MKTVRAILAAGILAAFAVPCIAAASCCAIAKPDPPKIRVLFEVGGYAGHDADKLPKMLAKLLEDTGQFTVKITQDRDQFRAENLARYDAILSYTTSGTLTKEQEQGLTGWVAGGGAMVGIHSATDSFHDSDAYWKMMGGSFIGHGSGTFKVKITGKSHVIVQGMEDFEITDETYRHKFHPESKIIVLMRREEDGEPVSWVQYYGKGRVFATGLGHGTSAWENPSFQKLITRALLWATKRLNP